MQVSPEQDFSPEQQHAYGQIAGFFARAEREFPDAAGRLANLIGGLVGEEQTTQRKLQDGMGNIDVGLALIGDWLKEAGVEGFDVKLGLGGGAKKAIARKLMPLPNASELISVASMGNPRAQDQIQSLLSIFSMQVWMALDVGLSPRQIVGGLLAESVGSRLSENGSEILREALKKPLGGHFEWIREALGIADVAGQPGFREKTTQPAGKEERGEQVDQPKARQAERVSPAKKELPAFLKGDELPEGYEQIVLAQTKSLLIHLDTAPGGEVVCYVGNMGIVLAREEDGRIYFRFKGLALPQKIPGQRIGDVSLTDIGPKGIPFGGSVQRISLSIMKGYGAVDGVGIAQTVCIYCPDKARAGNKEVEISGLTDFGMKFILNGENLQISNESDNFSTIVAVPSAAIMRSKASTEVALPIEETGEESMMMLRLSELSEIEGGQGKQPDVTDLYILFVRTQGDFSRLPADSRLRTEMIKSALEQLGETGEKLKKAGKNDDEIFSEWLRQVFLALYKRAVKT